MSPWLMLTIGWLTAAAAMSALWLVQRRTGHASIADVGWSFGVGLLSIFFAAFSFDGTVTRRLLVASLAGIWAFRLGGHLLHRVLTMPEDGRYVTLKQQYGEAVQWRLFRFFQLQAAASVFFAVPMLVACQSVAPIGIFDYLAVAVWGLAIGGEMLADRQLASFRSSPENDGQVCQQGLWKYSRHPNYFFEWLHWWSYVLFAAAAPFGWLTFVGPLAMLFFLLKGTGIPLTEAQAIKSRGEAYRRYQRTTSAFFPWPPKAG